MEGKDIGESQMIVDSVCNDIEEFYVLGQNFELYFLQLNNFDRYSFGLKSRRLEFTSHRYVLICRVFFVY